ncbi:MAG TPA: RHS repeat-associated core domain-containing protein, partial [Acetobacteraceae bacterium]|nr:RHS repeat-associated core domain-containing protein [Acetobacteraceae bacterium]
NVAPGGGTVSLSNPDRVYWALADNEGTVRDLIDASGNEVSHYLYDSFGKVLAGDTTLTHYLYAGQYFDGQAGLQYNHERWYDASLGRWLSQDPLGYAAGDANLYRYVGNSPTNFIDRTGLDPSGAEGNDSGSGGGGGGGGGGDDSGEKDDPSQFVIDYRLRRGRVVA